MDSYGTNTTNHCSMHLDRDAVASCPGCGEYFCKECLGQSGYCPACSSTAERFLEGFSGALARWEAKLHNPEVRDYGNPPSRGKILSLPELSLFSCWWEWDTLPCILSLITTCISARCFSTRGICSKHSTISSKPPMTNPKTPICNIFWITMLSIWQK